MDNLEQNEEVKVDEEKKLQDVKEEVDIDNKKQEENAEKDLKKKGKMSKKKKIILGIIVAIFIIEIGFYVLIQCGQWSTGHGDEFELRLTGEFSFCDEGAGSPVGNADLYARYIYLGHRNIIVFGPGKIGRVSISKITPLGMTVKFDGKTYELINMNL